MQSSFPGGCNSNESKVMLTTILALTRIRQAQLRFGLYFGEDFDGNSKTPSSDPSNPPHSKKKINEFICDLLGLNWNLINRVVCTIIV